MEKLSGFRYDQKIATQSLDLLKMPGKSSKHILPNGGEESWFIMVQYQTSP